MVSARRLDTLRDPTAAVQELYQSSSTFDNFPRLVADHFSNVYQAHNAFQEIPTLDTQNPPHTFPDGSLVRFRAMVQDTSLSSEMYLSKSKSGNCGGWGIHDTSEGEEDDRVGVDYADLRECTVLWAVNVPGESSWYAHALDGPDTQQERPPRPTSVVAPIPQFPHKYPNPIAENIGVQVKIYDIERSEALKATDVVTFVGILCSEPCSLNEGAAIDVPTLHVLFTRQDPYNLVRHPENLESDKKQEDARRENLARLREDLITWIANEALGGDRNVAEWVLLLCIARVQSRNPPLLPPSLTISHFPPPPTPSTSESISQPSPTLSFILGLLLPLSDTLPLSLASLNEGAFSPESKNEDLHAGVLQLPQGTVLLVTEGSVREGKLVERGLMNLHALQEVMSTQTLAYVFPFSQFSFPTDISCIVLSEGTKSAFFKTDLIVPLKSALSPSATVEPYKPAESVVLPPAEKLTAFRDLLLRARSGKVQVSGPISEYIQSDFVRDRQQDKAVTSDDLIRRMTIAKLYALSLHETSLTVETWERAKAFDERRRAALRS
ncbi:Mini-chromosome maintenance complex-binding protein [Grifola frondosa]|uniref:Mini-chromosome maintenance complex-binding protein n=1 Tax=Grifola frondosa TaxID=5627 RepID=A0A1C7MGA6_GRIFR|nr:Mini-chromosome maintenance complex-binding protein [Grifola frondosa]